ncbi:hypothetical protein Tco_0135012 [Tanacetum coccineum]
MVVQSQPQMGEGSANPTDPHHTPTIIQTSTQPQKKQQPRKPKRKDTQVPQSCDHINVADETVHKELGNSLVRAATTASSLEAEQDNGNITKTQSKTTPNESGFQGTNSGGGPRCQETMGDTTAQTRFKSVSKLSNDSLLARGNTLQSDKDSLKLNELMTLCTNLQNRVHLEKTKTTQQNKIDSLERRVNKLEKRKKSRSHGLKRLYKVGLTARVKFSDEESLGEDASKQRRIDADNVLDDAEMFVEEQDVVVKEVNDEVNVVEEVVEAINSAKLIVDAAQVSAASVQVSAASAATTVSVATTTAATSTTVEDITLAQALEEMKRTKPKLKGVVIQENISTRTTISSQQTQGKSKAIIIEHEKPLKKKDQIRLDEETDLRLQAEFDEEERLAREEAKSNIFQPIDDQHQSLHLVTLKQFIHQA